MSLPARILEEQIVPVARGLDASSAPALVEALIAGGIHSLEVTVEGASGLEALASVADGDVVVGAGTIVTVSQARRAVEAGARFLVSPHLDVTLLEWAEESGVPLIPGALTPTEIATAWRYGPAAVKVFPAHVGGPDYVKSLLGPYPHLSLIPTGGVDRGNAADYLIAGAVAVGVGGWLTGHTDLAMVTERAAQLKHIVV